MQHGGSLLYAAMSLMSSHDKTRRLWFLKTAALSLGREKMSAARRFFSFAVVRQMFEAAYGINVLTLCCGCLNSKSSSLFCSTLLFTIFCVFLHLRDNKNAKNRNRNATYYVRPIEKRNIDYITCGRLCKEIYKYIPGCDSFHNSCDICRSYPVKKRTDRIQCYFLNNGRE